MLFSFIVDAAARRHAEIYEACQACILRHADFTTRYAIFREAQNAISGAEDKTSAFSPRMRMPPLGSLTLRRISRHAGAIDFRHLCAPMLMTAGYNEFSMLLFALFVVDSHHCCRDFRVATITFSCRRATPFLVDTFGATSRAT